MPYPQMMAFGKRRRPPRSRKKSGMRNVANGGRTEGSSGEELETRKPTEISVGFFCAYFPACFEQAVAPRRVQASPPGPKYPQISRTTPTFLPLQLNREYSKISSPKFEK